MRVHLDFLMRTGSCGLAPTAPEIERTDPWGDIGFFTGDIDESAEQTIPDPGTSVAAEGFKLACQRSRDVSSEGFPQPVGPRGWAARTPAMSSLRERAQTVAHLTGLNRSWPTRRSTDLCHGPGQLRI